MDTAFSPAEILLPKGNSLSLWSVVACDQYTSEPHYWERVAQTVGEHPSTLHMILPEVFLEDGAPERIERINRTMEDYLRQGLFTAVSGSYLYLERTLLSGKVRRGLLGKVDLEAYDYKAGARSLIRPTEGTVESRLPPRIKVREEASLELPHIMLLIDDPDKTVIEPLAAAAAQMRTLYEFPLMEQGGSVCGRAADAAAGQAVDRALQQLAAHSAADGRSPLLFAVGDGNHSLATAKACFEQLKQTLPKKEWKNHPARYALVEVVNIHDEALEFEPIHRVLFGVKPQKLLDEFYAACGAQAAESGAQSLQTVVRGETRRYWMANTTSQLAVGTLQQFIDRYLAQNGGTVDYIHGDDVVEQLTQQEDTVGFLLPPMQKSELFPTVCLDGALPRKTFSMGHAHEKRFYLECRRIK